ncbi:WecB/TagA/CpsF family glycosyltransferase [Nostoc sp. CHAB 5834]|nr:WecB/TagA/CpsF family glycosyltransferase [Nostoc sp. CHAB 5834]
MTVEATHNPAFAYAVNKADWVTADGMPMTWALRRHQDIRQERVAGIDMLPDIIKRATEERLPVFFYGSTPDVLTAVTAVCRERYTNLPIAGTLSPSFNPQTEEDDIMNARIINESGARIVFVALGCPKQEYWMARMRGRVQAVMLGIGGALPILAGIQSRSPRWMQRMGLEWTYRLAMEPRRLFRRYAVTNSIFVMELVRQSFRRNWPDEEKDAKNIIDSLTGRPD